MVGHNCWQRPFEGTHEVSTRSQSLHPIDFNQSQMKNKCFCPKDWQASIAYVAVRPHGTDEQREFRSILEHHFDSQSCGAQSLHCKRSTFLDFSFPFAFNCHTPITPPIYWVWWDETSERKNHGWLCTTIEMAYKLNKIQLKIFNVFECVQWECVLIGCDCSKQMIIASKQWTHCDKLLWICIRRIEWNRIKTYNFTAHLG